MRRLLRLAVRRALPNVAWKRVAEAWFWIRKRIVEGRVDSHGIYPHLYKETLGLGLRFNKSGMWLLDVGCGPGDPLAWADKATVRVGVDPLAPLYSLIGPNDRKTDIVLGRAERTGFGAGLFDLVTMVNCLDHVENPWAAIAEAARVLKVGGTLVVLVDVDHDPTDCEPHRMTEAFLRGWPADWFEIVRFDVYGKPVPSGTWSAMLGLKDCCGPHGKVAVVEYRRVR